MRDGFIKIAAATPDLHVADCEYNAAEIVKQAKQAAAKGAKLITFPAKAKRLPPSSSSVCRCASRASCTTSRLS